MGHSYSRNHIHVVFSTKERRNTIPKEWQSRLWAYLGGICEHYEMVPVGIGGTENHIHVLFHLPAKLSLAKAVQVLKANSSKWVGEQGIRFAWQEGYELSASAHPIWIKLRDMFATRKHIIAKSVLRMNFAHCSKNMEWTTIQNVCSAGETFTLGVPPRPGLRFLRAGVPTASAVG